MENPHAILNQLGFAAQRRFGQNFLVNREWAEKLTRPILDLTDVREIWEIGPGLGALTAILLEQSQVPVRVFEIDRGFVGYLKNKFPDLPIEEGDFLKCSLEKLAKGKEPIGLVSNLPYNISSPIFFSLLENRHLFRRMVLTFQREFAERLIAQPNSKSYGGPSVLAQHCFEIRSLGNLPKTAFHPAPDVISKALSFESKTGVDQDLSRLSRLVKCAFAHRRKKFLNNVRNVFPQVDWAAQLEEHGLENGVRAENLPVSIFAALARNLPQSPPDAKGSGQKV